MKKRRRTGEIVCAKHNILCSFLSFFTENSPKPDRKTRKFGKLPKFVNNETGREIGVESPKAFADGLFCCFQVHLTKK